MSLESKLLTIKKEDVEWLSLNGIICQCKVIDVYDGDTVTLIIPYYDTYKMIKCRLLNIDTAEKRTKNKEEKKFALDTTEYMKTLILDKIIWVRCSNFDKYGRTLGSLYLSKDDFDNDKSLNMRLIKEGYAYLYNKKTGLKKKDFNEWYNNRHNNSLL